MEPAATATDEEREASAPASILCRLADSADTPAGVVHPASFPNCNAKTRSSWMVGWLPFLDIHCFFQSFALESPNNCARAGLAQAGRLRRTTRRPRRLWWRTARCVTRQRSAAHPIRLHTRLAAHPLPSFRKLRAAMSPYFRKLRAANVSTAISTELIRKPQKKLEKKFTRCVCVCVCVFVCVCGECV